ncbi:MAG: gliding motility-associated C-terminal domain-containing protein, partial [Candidatus Latescibacteria bacterium]|nr:gliding motility-associated C-terminal domain-containing protein [Candidatus Latescibacterota bacterium]
VVFLPDLAGSQRLIGDLEIVPPVLTPNGDGINDQVQIRFALFKVEGGEARVGVYDLSGRLLRELGQPQGREVKVFQWDGRDQEGGLVAPGIYLCHIDVGAEAGEDKTVHPLIVAY